MSYAQTEPTSKELREAKDYATEYLVNRGAAYDNVHLMLKMWYSHTLLFEDRVHNIFIDLARKPYDEKLSDRVLAFSMGSTHGTSNLNNTISTLFNYYNTTVRNISEGNAEPKDTASVAVMPLMPQIRWGQFQIGNIYPEQTSTFITGCGPTAIGQIMKHYEWPDTIRHDLYYKGRMGQLFDRKLDGTPIDWSIYKGVYPKGNNSDIATLAPMIGTIGMTVNVLYDNKDTNTQMDDIKCALITHFGYSPQMYVAYNRINQPELIQLIRNELKAGRPCILCGGGHIFVCDGAYEDFLHLNMGWAGEFDGWYRFPYQTCKLGKDTYLQSAMLNIHPQKQNRHRTLVLEKPGILAELLTAEEKSELTSLKISGNLNGKDIKTLRRMAGCRAEQVYGSWQGSLMHLDLSGATIIKDTVNHYFELDAKEWNFSTSYKGERYEFHSMTHARWLQFLNNTGNCNPNFRISETIPDSIYMMKMYTSRNVIGGYMFLWCENLQSVILPNNTRSIDWRAFSDCRSLQSICLGNNLYSIGSAAFDNTRWLTDVSIGSSSKILTTENIKPDNPKYYFKNSNINCKISVY